jgi:hypothetical protein
VGTTDKNTTINEFGEENGLKESTKMKEKAIRT